MQLHMLAVHPQGRFLALASLHQPLEILQPGTRDIEDGPIRRAGRSPAGELRLDAQAERIGRPLGRSLASALLAVALDPGDNPGRLALAVATDPVALVDRGHRRALPACRG